tara:strand:+ start:571 stop:1137 length:567 start_codon:yes stop_codon:yes gene_type:complete
MELKNYIKSIFFLNFIFLIFQNSLYAEDRNIRLNKLFHKLKVSDFTDSYETEQKIWKIWSTHPNNEELTLLLSKGSDSVFEQNYFEALQIFTKIINLDPSWAEAWNKRATVLYMIGEFKESQNDIDKVLELEQRHFGALAGQGLVNIELENYEKAIKSYEKAKELYPYMRSPEIMIKRIKELIKKRSI